MVIGEINQGPGGSFSKPGWEDLFEAVGQSIMILDRDHRVLAANRATLKITGLKLEDFLGKKCHDVMHGSLCPPSDCPMDRILKSKKFQKEEMLVEALDRYFLVSCSPVLDENGDVERIIHIASDITDSKRTREELDSKVKEIELLMDIIQHDIGNIHQGIKLFLQLAVTKEGVEREELLNGALESSIRAERLTKNVKNFEKIKDGSEDLREMDLLKILKDSIRTAKLLHPNPDMKIRLSSDIEVLKVKGNSLLEEMFVNLIDNSLKYGSVKDGEVSVLVASRKGNAEVLVMDEGPGIPEKYRDVIFQRFKRIDERKNIGSGMGLMICRKVASSVGAEVSAVDRPDGMNGACFKVEFSGI